MTALAPELALADRPRGTTLAGLVGVELRRLWWRRLTKVVLLAAVIVTGVTVYTAYAMTSPETVARSLDAYEREVASFPEMVTECQRAQQEARDAGQADADFGCAQLRPPTLESFGMANPLPAAVFSGLLTTNGPLYALLAFLLGASFVAAEFATGALGTWLTFQPRRLRVGLSKLVGAVGGGVLVAGTGFGLAGLGAWMIGVVNRPGSELVMPLETDVGEPLWQLVLRHGAVVMGAGLVGAAFAFVTRSTAAVAGLVAVYGVVVEGVLSQGVLHGRPSPWLVSPNVTGFLERGTTYPVQRCTPAGCDYTMQTLSYTHGWVYLTTFVLLVGALALLVFRRRDVS